MNVEPMSLYWLQVECIANCINPKAQLRNHFPMQSGIRQSLVGQLTAVNMRLATKSTENFSHLCAKDLDGGKDGAITDNLAQIRGKMTSTRQFL